MSKARDIASAAPAPSTVSATELGYLDGVSSAIQTQIDGKQAANANVSTTELGYLDGVTSAIQTQLDGKTAKNTLTTTGDIYYASSANTPARLGIGSTGNVLTVAGGVPSWATPAGGSFVGCSAAATGLQSISTATWTAQNFTATDLFDTDAFHNPSSNSSRITIPSGKGGKYHFSFRIYIDTANSTGRRIFTLYKNGAAIDSASVEYAVVSRIIGLNTGIISLDAGDYIEAFVFQSSGSTLDTYGEYCSFAVQYLGA